MTSISHYPEDGVTIISSPPEEGDTVLMMRFIDPGLDEEYAAATASFRKEAKARSKADPLAFTVFCAACDKEMPRGDAKTCAQCESASYCDKERSAQAALHRTGQQRRRAAHGRARFDARLPHDIPPVLAVLALELHEHPERVAQSVLHLSVDLLAYVRALMRGDTPPPGTQRSPEMMMFTITKARAAPLGEVRGVSPRVVEQMRSQPVQGTRVAFIGIYFTAARRGPDGQVRSSMAVIPVDPRDFKGIKETPLRITGGMSDGHEYAKTRENLRDAFNNEVRMDKKNHFKLHQMLRPEPEPDVTESMESEEREEGGEES